jgi:PEP-CTERM motif
MFRIAIVSGITLFAVVAANAGQIQIGGVNGLTSSVVTGAGCTQGGPCTEKSYVPVLFESAPVTVTGGATLVDNAADGGSGVTFSKINDTGDFWALPISSPAAILTIPIGQFGVTDVWTMINDIEATKANDVSVVFNFGTSATVTSDSVTVKLGDADGVSATGQVRNALVCNGGCAESSQVGLTSGTVINGVTVMADNVWSQPYSILCQGPLAIASSVSSSTACGAQGTAYLDDQGFFFNGLSVGAGLTNLNTYLVSVQVKEIATGGGGSGLSAITIDTAAAAATPEPSTVLLFIAGLGVVGLGRLRKRA